MSQIIVTIDTTEDGGMSMGISADEIDSLEIFRALIAGAEATVYGHVSTEMAAHGADPVEVAYAAPLRTRLLALEQLMDLDMQPYAWIDLER